MPENGRRGWNQIYINSIPALQTVIAFLYENEQFGDDWQEEIRALEELLDTLQDRLRTWRLMK